MFLIEGVRERDWTNVVHYKYEQIWRQLMGGNPEVTLETLDEDNMVELKEWKIGITELIDKFDDAKLKQAYELIRTLE